MAERRRKHTLHFTHASPNQQYVCLISRMGKGKCVSEIKLLIFRTVHVNNLAFKAKVTWERTLLWSEAFYRVVFRYLPLQEARR